LQASVISQTQECGAGSGRRRAGTGSTTAVYENVTPLYRAWP
jgi:hypothetical protein